MDDPANQPARLAALLPDTPRFVEARGMLLGGNAEVSGFEDGEESPGFVVREEESVCVVGLPRISEISEAARDEGVDEVISTPDNVSLVAEALPGWEARPAVLHLLGDEEHLPEAPEGGVRLLSGVEELGGVLPELGQELRAEFERAFGQGKPVAATFVGELPVSFCYAASETESLWDVSIDTLEGHRGRGYAASCAAYMIRHMRRVSGKEPVWDALESNAASMGLAARLGFTPVDRLFIFLPARDAEEHDA